MEISTTLSATSVWTIKSHIPLLTKEMSCKKLEILGLMCLSTVLELSLLIFPMNEWMLCCRWRFFLVVNLLFFHIYELLWWLHKGMRNAIQYYQISYKKVGNCEKKMNSCNVIYILQVLWVLCDSIGNTGTHYLLHE